VLLRGRRRDAIRATEGESVLRMNTAVAPTHAAMPGHLPLAAHRSVMLQPRMCGELKVGAGRVSVNDKLLAAGDRIRLWAGDRVEVVNVTRSGALYAWDLCSEQPSWRERLRRAASRMVQAVTLRKARSLQACSNEAWCLHP
ncbi:MAG TPA: hypothetical protein VMZ74_16645, partial [Ramlibacter sp.]|nr:hypothetical protein [Ramlibacter sp.]